MSLNYIYNEVKPEAEKDLYVQNDNIDFRVNFNNQSVIPNSFFLTGRVALYDNSNNKIVAPNKVFIKNMIGVHGLFDSFVISTQKQGNIENFQNYGRYVNMDTTGKYTNDDTFNSEMQCELRCPDAANSNLSLLGQALADGTRVNDSSFFMKPDICLNNMSSSTGKLPYMKTGEIMVSLRLAANALALFGDDCPAQYKISDLKLFYLTIDDAGEAQPMPQLLMRVKGSTVSSINSPSGVINIRSPLVADRIFMSFINALEDKTDKLDSYRLELLPNLNNVEYIYNDNLNGQISYEIDNLPEILHYTEVAFNDMNEKNNFDLNKLYHNNSFCLGFKFGFRQLENSKISIQVKSDITTEYNVYSYLLGELQL